MFEPETLVAPHNAANDSVNRSRAPIKRLALIGNALPRKCGLATFTTHLAEALRERFPDLTLDHYAMDDDSMVEYGDDVSTIRAEHRESYLQAARQIQANGTDALWLQHEFGIFGGEAGAHILDLVEATDLPLVVTLHTVLEKPTADQARVFERLLDRADVLVVMAQRGAQTLRRRYNVDPKRIVVIPHGVPDRQMIDPERMKPRFGLQGRTVLMTFGLLAPDKGVDRMIEAMPAIVARHPEALYLVVGATHPNFIRNSGECYRESLERRVEELGLGDHVRFHNSFVEQDELLDMLQASDIYITPYLNMAQVTSGTLSYAAAVGKPIVSTPYVHASELLADGRGILVEPGSSEALATAVLGLLDHPERKLGLSNKIYRQCRSMVWPQVVERALGAIAEHRETPKAEKLPMAMVERGITAVPIEGVCRMSDDTGIFQHSLHGVPDWAHGYCIDDNARALLMAVSRGDSMDPTVRRLTHRYAAFVQGAWNPDNARFRNFMAFDRRWLEDSGSDDSCGRALWALGVATAVAKDPAIRSWSRELYDRATSAMAPLDPPRAQAFAALGAYGRLRADPAHHVALDTLDRLGRTLEAHFAQNARDGWDWYEPVLAYDNARLCEAQIRAGQTLERPEWIAQGLKALDWLTAIQRGARGQFRPVGHESFFRPYQRPGMFDQQPVEITAMIDAAAAAFDETGDDAWIDVAESAFRWFVGDNDCGIPVAIPEEGSCFDGLMRNGVNRNQGAESILAFQLAAIGIRALSSARKVTTRAPVSS